MAGNVQEWTSSLYWEYPYDARDGREDPTQDGKRVRRGGSWYHQADVARCASRGVSEWYVEDYDIGFRCATSSVVE